VNRISRAFILGLVLTLGLIEVGNAQENLQQKAIEAAQAASLPGTLDGEYVLIQFETSFENKSLSLNKRLRLNPPLKKGDIGGFALDRSAKIPPPPLLQRGNIICGQVLRNPPSKPLLP
jgi:hypothetical protein